jgi:hypothetical protein
LSSSPLLSFVAKEVSDDRPIPNPKFETEILPGFSSAGFVSEEIAEFFLSNNFPELVYYDF